MKNLKSAGKVMQGLAVAASLLFVTAQAHASLFNITFKGDGNLGSGEFYATETGADSGVYSVNSGTFQITSGSLAGTYSLFPDSPISGAAYSPTDYFYYDNGASPSVPCLDLAGLLFTGSNGLEINLFGYPTATEFYTIYANNGFNASGVVTLAPATPDVIKSYAASVPECATVFQGALLLFPFAVGTLRSLRRRRLA
jgi:hypothetical protein